jgi:hypothetical protein
VTIQTGPAGKLVSKILIAQDVYYEGPQPTKEFYLSILLDRAKGMNVVMYSTEGGMDIEEVAEHTPHLIFTEEIDPSVGLQGFQARQIAFNLGLSGEAFKEMVKFVDALYKYIGGIAAELRNTSSLDISAIFILILKVPKSIRFTTPFNFCKILLGLIGPIPFKPAFATEYVIGAFVTLFAAIDEKIIIFVLL